MLTLKSLVLAFAAASATARGLFASDASVTSTRASGRSLLQLEDGEIPTRANIISFDALPSVTPPCNPVPGEPCTDGIMLLNDDPLEPAPNMPLSVTRTPNEQFDFPGPAFTAAQVRAVFAALAILVRAPPAACLARGRRSACRPACRTGRPRQSTLSHLVCSYSRLLAAAAAAGWWSVVAPVWLAPPNHPAYRNPALAGAVP